MKSFFSILFLAMLAIPDATACSCGLRTLNEFVANADSIYLATLQEAKLIPGDFNERWPSIEGRFLVRKVLKGPPSGATVKLRTGTGGGDCGVPMSIARSYIIFEQTGSTEISNCDGSTGIEGFQEQEISEKIRSVIKATSRKRSKP